jgi:hypothetical protein
MTLPAITKTWVITPNNRITFVSLNDTMARYLFGIKAFLKTNGYTVIGSSNGVAAGMDAVDRWVTFSNVTTRGTAAATVQSWIVLRDGNGADILITYQGASDNIARISFSPGQLFVAAGTPTQQPTATDEQVVTSAADLINATASVDRVWHGWVSNDAKFCRFAIARAGAWVGRSWGIENFTHALVAPAAIATPVWGFALPVGQASVTSGIQCGVARVTVSAVPFNCLAFFGCEFFQNNPVQFTTAKPELQSQWLIFPLSIASSTASARGKLGNLIDQWIGRTDAVDGSYYGQLQFLSISGYQGSGGVWPWDGVTVPVMY